MSVIGRANLVDGLYRLNCEVIKPRESNKALVTKCDQNTWHRRLGHICDENLKRVMKSTIGVNCSDKSSEKCITCIKGKQTRCSFPDNGNRANELLELIHSDVCGPIAPKSLSGARYYVSFIDDYSRKVFIEPVKKKSQVFEKFIKFKNLVDNQCSRKIKVFRSDNGTEFCNQQFETHFKAHGIIHQKTAPYTPEQNGVAERGNRTIMERVRCMLLDSGLNASFWAEPASTAVYLMNRVPCRGKLNTPEEIWTGAKPDLSNLRAFGSRAMVHVPKEKRTKLESKSIECVMLGYSDESKAYRLFDKSKRKLIISRDVIFIEDRVSKSDIKNIDDIYVKPGDDLELSYIIDSGEDLRNESYDCPEMNNSLNRVVDRPKSNNNLSQVVMDL